MRLYTWRLGMSVECVCWCIPIVVAESECVCLCVCELVYFVAAVNFRTLSINALMPRQARTILALWVVGFYACLRLGAFLAMSFNKWHV